MNKSRDSKDLYSQVQRRLIASLLYDGSYSNKILELVELDNIEEPSLALIFEAIVSITRRNEIVSAVSIATQLESMGKLKEAGGLPELYMLRDEGGKYLLEAPIEIYGGMVKESSAKTKIKRILKESVVNFTDDSGVPANEGVSELQSLLNSELYKLSDESTSSNLTKDFGEYLEVLDERERIAKENEGSTEGLQGIPSLLPSLNQYTTGWLPGQMITVAARTGVGKSIMAVNCAVAAAQAGKSVLFFSLEMGTDELTDRIVSSSTGILLSNLRQGRMTDSEKEILNDFHPEIRSMKIKIETEAKVTIDSIRAKALKQAQSEEGLDFIIIDYLQLITPVGRFSSRQEAVADISRNVKLLAKQLGIPIMVLAQLNRQGKDDENPIPKLDQIRESHALAQDSDVVFLLHRDETMDDTIPHTLVILEKNRNGEAQKTIRCHSNLECSLFREVIRSKDIERMTDEDEADLIDDFDLDDFDEMSDDFDDSEIF